MTPREHSRLQQLLTRVAELEPRVKDTETEARVCAAVARHPSLAYWLANRVLLLERALASADAQIEFLRDELRDQTALASREPPGGRAGGPDRGPQPGGDR